MQRGGGTSFISLPQKVVLLTYSKESEGQYFNDCSFSIATDIPPGPTGQYEVIFNEMLFQHSHPILTPDDYIDINITDVGGYRISGVPKKFFKLDQTEFINIFNTLLTTANCPLQFTALHGSVNGVVLGYPANTATSSMHEFTIQTSINIGYILNNINKTIYSSEALGYHYIEFPLLRFAGPFVYMVNTNLTPLVPTLNEAGKKFNMTLMTYNTTNGSGDLVQMASTMQCITSNITSLRIKLIDDQGRDVKLTSPIYIQMTVQPYIPPSSSSNIGYYK